MLYSPLSLFESFPSTFFQRFTNETTVSIFVCPSLMSAYVLLSKVFQKTSL